MDKKYILSFDEFLRSFKQNKDTTCAFLLGAGASISSGIQSASDCIWEWKKEIYTTSNPSVASYLSNIKSDTVKVKTQQWLDDQHVFPARIHLKSIPFMQRKLTQLRKIEDCIFQI